MAKSQSRPASAPAEPDEIPVASLNGSFTSSHSLPGMVTDMPELLGKVSTKGVKLLEGDDFISFASPRMAEALLDTGLTSEQLQPRNLRQHDAKGIVNGVVYSSDAVRTLRFQRKERLRREHLLQVLQRRQKIMEQGRADENNTTVNTAVAMAAAQGQQFLEQERRRAEAAAASQEARKQADQEEAARLAQVEEERRLKTARNLKVFEERKAAMEAEIAARLAAGKKASDERKMRQAEEAAAALVWAREREQQRLQKDKELEEARRQRELQARAKSLAFNRKQAQRIAAIKAQKAIERANMDKLAAETETKMAEKHAWRHARAEEHKAEIAAANKKKQQEIRRRLQAKRSEEKKQEAAEHQAFVEKIAAVDKRLVEHHLKVNTDIEAKKRRNLEELAAREVRQAEVKRIREMAGASGLNKIEMKNLICERVLQSKIDTALARAADAQLSYEEKLAVIEQNTRLDDRRRDFQRSASQQKASRSQAVLDAKQQLRDGRRQAAMLAVVERAKLGADAKEPRGAGFKPMAWMSDPLAHSDREAGQAATDLCRRISMNNFAAGLVNPNPRELQLSGSSYF